MAQTDRLITLEEARVWLDDIGNEKDALIARIIDYSTELILRKLDRRVMVNTAAITEYHSWVQGCNLWPYEWPVQSVTSVHETNNRTYDSTTLLTANTDYVIYSPGDERAKIVRLSSSQPTRWYSGFEYQQVIYVPGYADQASVPKTIKDVCCRHVSMVFKDITRKLSNLESVSDDMGSFARFGPAMLTSQMEKDLYPYMRQSYLETGERRS